MNSIISLSKNFNSRIWRNLGVELSPHILERKTCALAAGSAAVPPKGVARKSMPIIDSTIEEYFGHCLFALINS